MTDLEIRPHNRGCWAAVGYIDRSGTPRRMIIRAGGWSCPGCVDLRVHELTGHLEDHTSADPILWFGLLDDRSRRNASRRARALSQRRPVGRLTATRVDAPAVVLSTANITPRELLLLPLRTAKALASLADELALGPRVRRIDWSDHWRPPSEAKNHSGGVRFGVTTPELMDEAIRAAGLEPDMPSTLDPPIAAARVAEQIEKLREARDLTGWDRKPIRATESDRAYTQAS